jgi:hypothetical protein
MQVNENLNYFDEAGHLLVRNVFDTETISRWRKRFRDELQLRNSRLLVDGIITFPEMREALSNARLMDVLRTLLGKPFVVLPLTSVDHNRYGQFHKDTTGAEMGGWSYHKDEKFRIVVVGIYLQDNNDYGGGLTLVSGSHRLPDPYVALIKRKHQVREITDRSFIRRTLKRLSGGRLFTWQNTRLTEAAGAVAVPTKAGDVLIWDKRIVHRATPQKVKGEALPGGKIALFYELGVNNEPTMLRLEQMKAMGELKARDKDIVIPPSTEDIMFT